MHWVWAVFVPAAVYQGLAVVSEGRYLGRRATASSRPRVGTGVSVLKPLRGLDPNSYPAFVSQVRQDYPEFEVLFGASDADDPALAQVRKLQLAFPDAPIRVITGGPKTKNAKVGVLLELSRQARFPLLVVNDSDIKVTPEYLARVTEPLNDRSVGLVTCLYRVQAHNLPSAWEALGITTDFMPSALVAQAVGVREFGMGSTLAFRAADFEAVGGFAAIADYIADDYQLAKRITASGKRAVLSTYAVETSLGDATWGGIWRHQLRWARTIRASKGLGFAGLPITHAGVWAAIAFALGAWPAGVVLVGLRILSAFLAAAFVLASTQATVVCWLAPVWDLYSFAVWAASYAGRKVRWRDRLLEIDSLGRIR